MNCPECGILQRLTITSPETPDDDGFVPLSNTVFTYSCEHYADLCQHPRCRFCGRRDSPVRQVPAPIAYSDCYCDACAELAKAFFMAVYEDSLDRAPGEPCDGVGP